MFFAVVSSGADRELERIFCFTNLRVFSALALFSTPFSLFDNFSKKAERAVDLIFLYKETREGRAAGGFALINGALFISVCDHHWNVN